MATVPILSLSCLGQVWSCLGLVFVFFGDHINLQSEGTQDAFYEKNTRNLGELERAFFTEKHRSRPGWVIRGL